MSKYMQVVLDQEAIGYIREHLTYGSALGRYLLQCKDIFKGKVVTFLPAYVGVDQAKQFLYGGKVKTCKPTLFFEQDDGTRIRMVPKGSTDHYLAWQIKEYLGKSTDRLCIIEESLMKPNDPGFPDVDIKFVKVMGDEIYYVISGGKDNDEQTIQDLLGKTNPGWHFLAVLTSVSVLNKDMSSFGESKITEKELRELAEKTESIIVAAYDGEGYLIWSEE